MSANARTYALKPSDGLFKVPRMRLARFAQYRSTNPTFPSACVALFLVGVLTFCSRGYAQELPPLEAVGAQGGTVAPEVLHSFTGSDGAEPYVLIQGADGS